MLVIELKLSDNCFLQSMAAGFIVIGRVFNFDLPSTLVVPCEAYTVLSYAVYLVSGTLFATSTLVFFVASLAIVGEF